MKKILSFILSILFVMMLASCDFSISYNPSKGSSGESSITPSESTKPTPGGDVDPVGFVIHFDVKDTMDDGTYKYDLWLWEKGKDGADYDFNGEDEYGIYAKYTFESFSSNIITNTLGFIVKTNKTWAEGAVKDYDGDRYMEFNQLEVDSEGYYHIWLMTQSGTIYTTANLEVSDQISYCSFAHTTNKGLYLTFKTNKEFTEFKIKAGNEVLVDQNTVGSDANVLSNSGNRIEYKLTNFPDLTVAYSVEVKFADSGKVLTRTANKTTLYSLKQFEELYCYDGTLGAIYTKEQTEFKVWTPISTSVKLRIYDNGTPTSVDSKLGNDAFSEYKMTKGEKGVWATTITGDLQGKYYTYVVTNDTYKDAEVVDPYALSTGVNGLRGMIVDFSKTNPEGWDEISIHEYSSTQLTVYETHIADLTSSTTWGGTSENAKKYKGFYESGTTYTKDNVTVTTGFDHIKELGVNAVQIIPFFDQANDEINTSFNWGYNPLNYNSLEGSYSSNPYDGYTKIKEFKELVLAYNKAGINIIMDVVYNHVNSLQKCNFDVLMPGYYFRYTSSGDASNGSGCGNETASENYMFRKFMIDSTQFWASEYKLGGFRFDLMGVHDIETMNQLAKNLHENVSEYVTVYGEPWAGGTIALNSSSAASQANMNKYEGYGCFNDQMRDALIKGGLSAATEKGWVSDDSKVAAADVNKIKNGLTGLILSGNKTLEVEKCVNYVTCHDNYTLYDRFKAAGITDEATIKKMAMLANSVVFTSQGTTFMLAGEEFLRTKGGNSNSYNSTYEVNELNYALKVEHYDLFENYQKLIALKQNKNLFGKDSAECKNLTINTNTNGSLIHFTVTDTTTRTIYKIAYANGVVQGDKTVNFAGYTLYLDTLGTNVELNAQTTLQNYQTIIAYKKY